MERLIPLWISAQAIRCYKKIVELERTALNYQNLANEYYICQEYELAIKSYEHAIKLDKNYSLAYDGLGTSHGVLGDFDKAIEFYKKALNLDNENEKYLSHLGWALASNGEYEIAVMYLLKALKINPDLREAHFNLGFSYYYIEEYENYEIDDFQFKPENLLDLQKKPEEMSYSELNEFIDELTRVGAEVRKWIVELYLKISYPFANFIIILFGAPIAAQKRRSGTAVGIGISLLVCFIYFLFMFWFWFWFWFWDIPLVSVWYVVWYVFWYVVWCVRKLN